MRLSKFIRENMEVILQEWESFALTLNPMRNSGKRQLRDHAQNMLAVICLDLDTYQGERAGIEKSKGNAPAVEGDTAAEAHASDRMYAGFSIEELLAEYRAMRASVLRLWQRQDSESNQLDLVDMLRFNEAIDQSLTESVARFSSMLRDSQNVFMAILGHDVRNPLGAISMGAQLLMYDSALPADKQTTAKRIHDSTNRVNELVADLLDYATSHLGGGIPIKPAPYALGPQCELLIGEMRTLHPQRTFALSMSGALDVVWDRARVNQALSNLLGNAVQHGAPGAPVTLSVHGNNDLVLKIGNQGVLMDAASMRSLFNPGQQFAMRPADARTPDPDGHLGLGLYITREIVSAHGGQIALTSNGADGTTFTLTLPRDAASIAK